MPHHNCNMNSTDVWVTSSGQRTKIADLHDAHLENVINAIAEGTRRASPEKQRKLLAERDSRAGKVSELPRFIFWN